LHRTTSGRLSVERGDNAELAIKMTPTRGKTTLPGRKQVFLDTRNGGWSHLVALEDAITPASDLVPLLDCHIEDGRIVESAAVGLEAARRYCNGCLASLHEDLAGLEEGDGTAPVQPHHSLKELFKKAVG